MAAITGLSVMLLRAGFRDGLDDPHDRSFAYPAHLAPPHQHLAQVLDLLGEGGGHRVLLARWLLTGAGSCATATSSRSPWRHPDVLVDLDIDVDDEIPDRDPRTAEQKAKLLPTPTRPPVETEHKIPVALVDNGGRARRPGPRDIQPSRELPAVAARATDGISEGFRVEWLSFDDGELSGHLTSGAGCGSPYMTLSVTRGDVHHVESVDIRDLLRPWVDAVVADMDAGTLPEAVWGSGRSRGTGGSPSARRVRRGGW